MRKTYNCNSKADVKAAIARIIMAKVREIAGDKRIKINVKGDKDDI